MLSSVLTDPNKAAACVELLRPQALPNGAEPEERVVISGIPWSGYLAFDKVLGADRPGPRLYYLDGELEIMTTSHEHERIKKWIGDFWADYFLETGQEIVPRGQATIRVLKEAGAEPDESWCLGQEREFPDLVLEVALTSGGINKLEVYQRFKIPEVWFWRQNHLQIFVLGSSGNYEQSEKSRLLPLLNIPVIEQCVGIRSWQQARQAFRAGLSSSKCTVRFQPERQPL